MPKQPPNPQPEPSRGMGLGDIKSHKLLYLKGVLFLILGLLAAAGILLIHPSWKITLLLIITVWAFCRAYYLVFYVIQHYINPDYHFAGLIDFARYLLKKK